MTRNVRKGPQRHPAVDELDDDQVRRLTTGQSYFDCGLDDDESLRRTWKLYGPSLLAEWIAEQPGTRPWAWWKFDAPGERNVTQHWDAWHETNRENWLTDGVPFVTTVPPVFEPEVDFLRRHKLLTKDEKVAIDK